MDAALTTLREEDIQKHLATAQSLVTKTAVVEAASSKSNTEIAGTRRRVCSDDFNSGCQILAFGGVCLNSRQRDPQ